MSCPALCNSAYKQIIFLISILILFNLIFWLAAEPALYDFLMNIKRSRDWIINWAVHYSVARFVIWCFFTFLLVLIWYLIIRRFPLPKQSQGGEEHMNINQIIAVEDAVAKRVKTTAVSINEKARKTMGLTEDDINDAVITDPHKEKKTPENVQEPRMESTLDSSQVAPHQIKRNKTLVKNVSFENVEVMALPKYSPQARSSIFEFDQAVPPKQRVLPPFHECLHLVHVHSPTTPHKINILDKEQQQVEVGETRNVHVDVHPCKDEICQSEEKDKNEATTFVTTPIWRKAQAAKNEIYVEGLSGVYNRTSYETETAEMYAEVKDGHVDDVIVTGRFKLIADPTVPLHTSMAKQ